MPLWLDLLRTPMAAPETRGLRRMRFTWQVLCLSCALVVGFFGALQRFVGLAAVAAAVGLLLATPLYSALYLRAKQKADNAFLEQIGEADDA